MSTLTREHIIKNKSLILLAFIINLSQIQSDILGKIILTSGQLKGMGTMQRVENVIVHYGYPEIKIYIPLEFKNLEVCKVPY